MIKPVTKRRTEDPVIKELWSIKDATAARYATVGEYLAQLRAENRLKLRAARGDTKKGLALLDKLDKASVGKRATRRAQS
jgi:hypothetical protein